MSVQTNFTDLFIKVKKKNRAKLLFTFLRQVVVNNSRLFFFCTLLAVFTSIVNYNIGLNLRENFFPPSENENSGVNIFQKKNFQIIFTFFKLTYSGPKLGIRSFALSFFIFILVVKCFSSLLHYYSMHYAYALIEKDLKNDLFRHFVRAKYSQGLKVAPELISQFASDLDMIAENIWFIPNRLIYMTVSIFYTLSYGFNFGTGKINLKFLVILIILFSFLIATEVWLFSKAAKLNIAAKRRYEEDNKLIYEKINNLEYIKAVSGENYEVKKVAKQLGQTFSKNTKSLIYSVLFKAVPNYLIIPNIAILFVLLAAWTTTDSQGKANHAFLLFNFIHYYFAVQKLNGEVNKIIDALINLEELATNLLMTKENVKILKQRSDEDLQLVSQWENDDVIFEKVVFAYPQKPHQAILRDFSFCFKRGEIYGVAGKNGIGKSTITKSLLKLYDLQSGKILIGQQNIREINTASFHQRICYQTNRPGLFRLTIAENVFYPEKYREEDLPKLIIAAEKVGCWEFISNLPSQFQTMLREGGSDLSEGQKQQIAAMRIFIRDYDIYIFDEILSNVHPVLKETILANIFSQIKGKTTIVIDHHYKIFHHVDYVHQFTGEKLIEMKKSDFL
jgi:ABC-type multidrug transport system fused ATPase/permease subunit